MLGPPGMGGSVGTRKKRRKSTTWLVAISSESRWVEGKHHRKREMEEGQDGLERMESQEYANRMGVEEGCMVLVGQKEE